MAYTNLDMDVLRTLVTAQELGGFHRAADRIGRSQSAVSQQIRKLEQQVGEPLFRKEGRALALTHAGDVVLRYARRILELNDEALTAVSGVSLGGPVRFGVPSDLAETWLPAVLGSFKRAHRKVRVEAEVDRGSVLLERLDKGSLDLVVAFGNGARRDGHRLGTLPMRWIGPASGERLWEPGQPVPLTVFQPPCLFRRHTLEALDRAGLRWHVSFTSPSLSGLWAAVSAGLGLALRTPAGLPASVALLSKQSGLPPVPSIELCLHDAGRDLAPAVQRLKEIVIETLRANLSNISRG